MLFKKNFIVVCAGLLLGSSRTLAADAHPTVVRPIKGMESGRIETPIDSWQPVRAGLWRIQSLRSDEPSSKSPIGITASACPYPSLLFLNTLAPIRLAEPGCKYSTYKLSDQVFHIVGRCEALKGGEHVETTTLQTAVDGRHFTTVTTWTDAHGRVTLQRTGEFVTDCKADSSQNKSAWPTSKPTPNVIDYLSGAQLQAEDATQRREVLRGLEDVLQKTPLELRKSRYTCNTQPRTSCTLLELLSKHFVPSHPAALDPESFYSEITSPAARTIIQTHRDVLTVRK